MAIQITAKDLSRDLKRRFRKARTSLNKAIRSSSRRGRTLLARRTPVDQGVMKNAWRAAKTGPAAIVNDAPHAGIVETGARRHKVNRAGIESLLEWAQRKLGASPEEAKGIAFAIASKLAKSGQKGKFIARDALPELRNFVQVAFERELKKIANKRLIK